MSLNNNIQSFVGQLGIISENKNELYSMLIPIILSKRFLKNSKEKKQFVENVLGCSIANYAYASKTILVGKIVNHIENLELEQIFILNKKIISLLNEVIQVNNFMESNNIKVENKNNKESFFNSWSEYINHASEVDAECVLTFEDNKVLEKIINNVINSKEEIIKNTRLWQKFCKEEKNRSDEEYRDHREELSNYFETFSEREIMVIQSLMYIGRNAYTHMEFSKNETKLELFKRYLRNLHFDINENIEKSIEIGQMVGKGLKIADYFETGFKYIETIK